MYNSRGDVSHRLSAGQRRDRHPHLFMRRRSRLEVACTNRRNDRTPRLRIVFPAPAYTHTHNIAGLLSQTVAGWIGAMVQGYKREGRTPNTASAGYGMAARVLTSSTPPQPWGAGTRCPWHWSRTMPERWTSCHDGACTPTHIEQHRVRAHDHVVKAPRATMMSRAATAPDGRLGGGARQKAAKGNQPDLPFVFLAPEPQRYRSAAVLLTAIGCAIAKPTSGNAIRTAPLRGYAGRRLAHANAPTCNFLTIVCLRESSLRRETSNEARRSR